MTFNFHLRRRSYIFSYASQAELQKNTGHTCVSVAGGMAKFAYCIEYGLHQSSNLRFFVEPSSFLPPPPRPPLKV